MDIFQPKRRFGWMRWSQCRSQICRLLQWMGIFFRCFSHHTVDPFVSGWLQEKCWLWLSCHQLVAISSKRRRTSNCCLLLQPGYAENIQVVIQKGLKVSKLLFSVSMSGFNPYQQVSLQTEQVSYLSYMKSSLPLLLPMVVSTVWKWVVIS